MQRISKYFILINLLFLTTLTSIHGQSIDDTFGFSFEALPDLRALTIQGDGKILVLGKFKMVNNQTININGLTNVVRLNSDGTTDTSFEIDPALNEFNFFNIKNGVDGQIALKAFSSGGSKGLYVINSDGSIDDQFELEASIFFVEDFITSGDGYVSIAFFTGEGPKLVKLNKDGSINEEFGQHSLTGGGSVKLANGINDQVLLYSSFTEYDGIAIRELIRINPDGTLDDSFNLGSATELGDANVRDVKVQVDGKIFVSGSFDEFDGSSTSGGLIRLNTDGTIDESFNTNLVGNLTNSVWSISIADNGKLYLAGQSLDSNRTVVDLFSLNADGTINTEYDKVALVTPLSSFNQYLEVEINDDKVLLVSDMEGTEDKLRFGFVVTDLNSEILDINPAFSQPSQINDAALQEDGKIVVVGDFVKVNGELKNRIVRVLGNGELDDSFIIDSQLSNFDNSLLTSLAIQQDGKILIGGRIRNTELPQMIIRLNDDGSFDSDFQADANNSTVNQGTKSIVVLDDNRIVIGGSRFFNQNNQNSTTGIAILNEDGSVYQAFNNESLTQDFDAKIVQPAENGKLLVAGFNGLLGFIKRLNPDGSDDDTFSNRTDLETAILDIAKIEEELIFGGASLQGGSITRDVSAYKTDLDGNNLDEVTFQVSGTTETGSYLDLFSINNELLVAGKFNNINGVSQSNFAKLKLNGVIDPEFNFNFIGDRVSRLLQIDSEHILAFGSFFQVNDHIAFGAAKIKTVNTPSTITGMTQDLSTNEEESLTLSLDNLVIEDPDDFVADMTLIVSEGEDYSLDGLTITPSIDFNGTLTVPVVVNDGKDNSEIFDLSILVNPVNDVPVITAFNGTATTAEETSFEILVDDLSITDPDNTFPGDYSLSVADGDSYSVDGSNITPETDFNGTLTVSIITNDGNDDSQAFDISIEVTPVNDAPIITGTTLETITDNETPIELRLTDLIVTDPDNDYPTDFSLIIGSGDNYTLSGNNIVPTLEFIGNIVVPVIVNDGIIDSEPFSITVEVTEVTSIELGLVSKKIDVYPNPTEDVLNVTIDNQIFDDVRIRILDSNGRSVFNGTYKKELEVLEKSILLNPLGSGIYIVEIIQGFEFKTLKKIIKK